MPAPTYDLARTDRSDFFHMILVPVFAIATTGAAIAAVQLIGNWLSP
jgi:hypothetical protein